MFRGFITALVTPFKDGEIDWPAFDSLVEWQIEQGIHGLVPMGTTGESPTVSHDEHKAVVKRCIDVAAGRVPVIAGCGSNCTAEALELTREARQDGADGALVVTPYYNKPTQEGLIAHFTAVQDVGLPVILYDVPGRCGTAIALETLKHLAGLPNIVGYKDATNALARPAHMRRDIGPDFCLLSGENETVGAYLAQGGAGCISVTSNIAPAQCVAFFDAWEEADLKTFSTLNEKLVLLGQALFCESSPAPVKYAASVLGLCSDEVRLPLLPATQACRTTVDKALAEAGIVRGADDQALKAHG